MSIVYGLWTLAKYAFLIALVGAVAAGLFAFFHPVRFDARVRASLFAQKLELLFTYFFGLFSVRVVQRPSIQEIYLRLGFFERRLYRKSRREPKPSKPAPPSASPPAGPEVPPPPPGQPSEPAPVPRPPEPMTPPLASATVPTPAARPEAVTAAPVEAAPAPSVPSVTAPAAVSGGGRATPASPEPIPSGPEISEDPEPFHPDFREEEEPLPPFLEGSKKEKTSDSGFGAKLRGWRRRIRAGWKTVKVWYHRVVGWYERFSPIARDWFWTFLAGFEIADPTLRLRYGFADQPHLLGMTQGFLCQCTWMIERWNIRTDFHPVFTGNTILVRSQIGLKIHPWKVSWSFARLLLEKEFRAGLWELYAWYRARQRAESSGSKEKEFS